MQKYFNVSRFSSFTLQSTQNKPKVDTENIKLLQPRIVLNFDQLKFEMKSNKAELETQLIMRIDNWHVIL